jgi:hypothetical protein
MSRRSTYSRRGKPLLALVGVVAIAACGPDRPADSAEGRSAAAPTRGSVESPREPGAQLTPGSEQPVEPGGEYPFENFDLPDDDESSLPIVRHRLRIENGTGRRIVVAATAGAAPVVLDSLDPGDDIRVDLEAPADGLALNWNAIDGNSSGVRPIRVRADSVQVVRIGPR